MAIYSTAFVADPVSLLSGFPGWKLPLDTPVTCEVANGYGNRTHSTDDTGSQVLD